MNPVPFLYAFLGVCFYGLMNVLLQQKLVGQNIFAVYFVVYAAMWGVNLVFLGFSKGAVIPTSGTNLLIVLVLAVVFHMGNAFIFLSYNAKATVYTVTTTMMLIPVVAGIINLVWSGEKPNKFYFLSFAAAALAVIFSLMAMGKK